MKAVAAAALAVGITASQGEALAQTPGVTQECLPRSFAAADTACSAQLVAELRERVTGVATASMTAEQKIEAYKAIFAAATVPPACREAQALLFQAVAACNSSDLALSLDAPASNPASLALVERGGTIEDVALALRNSNFVSADDSAVTLHLNAAVALCGNRGRGGPGEPTPCFWDRLIGAVTFGARIPEQEIVGFSGIPDPERLLDVLVWDANLRLLGDRRPDSATWRREWNAMAVDGWVRLKGLNTGLFPADFSDERLAAEGGLLNAALQPGLMGDYQALQDRIGSSLLVSAGFSGQHLTKEAGENRYTGTLTVDKGLGTAAGLTFNASYSWVQDVPVADGPVVTLKTWRFAAGLSGDFMKGVLVHGRSTEWSLAGLLNLPADGDDVPVDRETVYEASLALRLPVSESAHVPIVVTYTNDPNRLDKQRYARGQVGIDYDFGALKKLFKD